MLILLIIGLASSQQCPSFSCQSTSSTQCVYNQNNMQWVYPCASDYYCNITSLSTPSYCSPQNFSSTRYPGDLCSLPLQCTSGSCVSGICSGPGNGESCTVQSGCLPGFYCDGSVCTSQLKPGSSCTEDYQCINSAFCNLNICVAYWTLTSGEVTEAPVNGLSMGCKSGAAISSGSGFICGSADTSELLPSACTLGSKCTSSTGQFTQDCVCGYNPSGSAYCPLFAGDPQVQSALTSSAAVLKVNSVCNTYSRFSLNCFSTNSTLLPDFLNFALNFTLIYDGFYPLIQKTQSCVNSVFNSDYYELTNAYKTLNQEECPASYCTNYTSYWAPGQCVLAREDLNNGVLETLLYSKSCPLGQVCDTTYSAFANASCIDIPSAKGYPGDFCNFTYQCYSNLCQFNSCLGIRDGEICVNAYDCMPGFFCNQTSLVCQALRKRQQSCAETYQCGTTLICNFQTCVPYYSVMNQGITNVYSNGFSQACASGFAVPYNDQFICANPPISASVNTCKNPGDLCYDSSGIYPNVCQCGIGASNSIYCPPFQGDEFLQNAITYQMALMQWNQMCNTFSRFSETCFLRNQEYLGTYYYYITNLTVYNNYPQLVNTQSCLESTYLYGAYMDQINLVIWENNQNNNPGNNVGSFAGCVSVAFYLILASNF